MKGLVASFLSKGSLFAFQLLTLMLLSRFVDKQYFGAFAIINSLYFFCIIVAEAGGMQQVINAQNSLDEKRIIAKSFLTSALGVAVMLLLLVLLPLLYSIDVSVGAMLLLISALLFYGVASSLTGVLYKELRFYKVAFVECTAELLSLGVALAYGYFYSFDINVLIIKISAYSYIRFLILWFFFKEHALFGNAIGLIRQKSSDSSGFSTHVTLSNLLSFFVRFGDNLVIGKLFSLEILSLYDRAYQLTKYPVMLIAFSLQPAIQPLVKKLKSFQELRGFLLKISAIFLVGGFFLVLLIQLNARDIIIFIIGEQWVGIEDMLIILSISIPFQAMYSVSGGIYYALSHPERNLKINLMLVVMLLVSILLGYFADSFLTSLVLISASFIAVSFICFFDIWYMERRMIMPWRANESPSRS